MTTVAWPTSPGASCPAQNFIYPYRAGYTGTAIQTQLVVAF